MVRNKVATACREAPRKTKNRPSRELYQTVHTISSSVFRERNSGARVGPSGQEVNFQKVTSDGHDTKSGTVKKERWPPKKADVKSVKMPLWNEIWATGLGLAKCTNKVVIKRIKQILFRLSVLRGQGEVS